MTVYIPITEIQHGFGGNGSQPDSVVCPAPVVPRRLAQPALRVGVGVTLYTYLMINFSIWSTIQQSEITLEEYTLQRWSPSGPFNIIISMLHETVDIRYI